MRYEDFPDYVNMTRPKVVRGCAKLALEFDSHLVKLLDKFNGILILFSLNTMPDQEFCGSVFTFLCFC